VASVVFGSVTILCELTGVEQAESPLNPLNCQSVRISLPGSAPHARRQDRFVDRVLAEAGVPLIRFRASAWYSVARIRERILQRLNGGTKPQRRRI